MQFCQQIAVFQSACVYADQLTEGGLKSFSRSAEYSGEVLTVILDAVAEILQGLDEDLSEEESGLWNIEIFTLCWWKTLSCVPELSELLTPAELRSVHKLPAWNEEFFFEIVNQHKWTGFFIQVAATLKPACGLLVMNHFINHILKAGVQKWNLYTVTNIAEFWFLTSNLMLQPAASYSSDHLETANQVSECMVTVLLNSIDFSTDGEKTLTSNDQAKISLLFLGILLRLDKERCAVIDLWHFSSQINEHINATTVFKKMQESFSKQFHHVDEDVLAELREVASIRLCLSESVLNRISDVCNNVITDDISNCFMNFHIPLLSCDPFSYISSGRVISLFLKLDNGLRSDYSSDSVGSDRESVYKCVTLCLNKFEKCKKTLSEYEAELEAHSSTVEYLFHKHLTELSKGNTEKMKASLLWLIENCNKDLVSDIRWLESIEKFASQFITSHEHFLSLVEALRISKEHLSDENHVRLQQVIINVYQQLPSDKHNAILLVLFCADHVTTPNSLFSVNAEQFDSSLRAVLNKLTNDAADLQLVTKSVSVFLLQNHIETVDRLVDFAVNNKDHILAIVKIIKQLSSIVSMKKSTNQHILYQQLNFYLYDSSVTDKQRKMAVTMFHSLISHVFISDDLQTCTEDFLQTCLVPFMLPVQCPLWKSDENDSRVFSQTLSLLTAISKHMSSVKQDWHSLKSYQPMFIIVWLSQIIDHSEQHWFSCGSSNDQIDSSHVREMSRMIVEQMLTVLKRVDIPDSWLMWLHQKMENFHWTLQNFLLPLYTKKVFGPNVIIPDSLQKILSLPESGVSIVSTSNDDMYEMYQCAVISDEILNWTLKSLRVEVIKLDKHCAVKCVCALSQLLPRCSLTDWKRVVDMTLHLSRSDCFESASTLNSCRTVFEQTWKLITDSLLLIVHISNNTADFAQISWQYLAENYASSLKACLIDQQSSGGDSFRYHDTYVYILGLVLHLVTVLPSAQTLVILAAELISMLPASCCSKSTAAAVYPCSCYKLIRQSLEELDHRTEVNVLINKLNIIT